MYHAAVFSKKTLTVDLHDVSQNAYNKTRL